MSNQIQNPNGKKRYDLGERRAKFEENIIEFSNTLPRTPVNRPLISQIVRVTTV